MSDDPILIDLPVPVITPRLILRPAMPGDGPALHEAKMETWDLLTPWMPWTKTKSSVAEDEALVRHAYARFIKREDMMMLGFCRQSEKLLLATGLHGLDWETRRFEIGYWVRKSAQGQGYAQESTNALTRYTLEAMKARAVVIYAALNNRPSHNVAQKLGFIEEGTFKAARLLPTGEISDAVYYVRTSAENLPPLDVHWGEQ